jgi:hypothetical protein
MENVLALLEWRLRQLHYATKLGVVATVHDWVQDLHYKLYHYYV